MLNKIYNGNPRGSMVNTETLKENILFQLNKFQQILTEYIENDNKKKQEKRIKFELSKKSAFTAFKRQIIKDRELLLFKKYFD